MKPGRAVEMTGRGNRGKPNPGFPSFPPALGNRSAIPTFPPPRPLVMFQNCQNQIQERRPIAADRFAPASRLILQ